MKKKKNKIYKALCELCKASIVIQSQCGNLYDRNSIQYLKEFCTIKCCSSRRSGHTTAIAEYCLENPLHSPNKFHISPSNILVICPTLKMSDCVRNAISKNKHVKVNHNSIECFHAYHIKFLNYDVNLGSIEQLREGYLNGFDLSTIIVDCSSMLTNESVDKIYRFASASMSLHEHKLIIFME